MTLEKEKKYKQLYMDIAHRVAQMSYARRLLVGAIIVKDGRILSMGFNGMPAGWDNNCEDKIYSDTDTETGYEYPYKEYLGEFGDVVRHYRLKTKPQVLHGEMNCMMKLARSNESSEGADLFLTHSPCMVCAKAIYQSGIRRLYFGKHYRDNSGIEFLEKSGVEVENFSD